MEGCGSETEVFDLFAEEFLHAFENRILGGIVRMVLRWYLEESRKRLLIPINRRSDLLCNMLVNEQYCNVFAFCEFLESCLN